MNKVWEVPPQSYLPTTKSQIYLSKVDETAQVHEVGGRIVDGSVWITDKEVASFPCGSPLVNFQTSL